MAQKYTRVPSDTFEKLQLNAGILLDNFDPATGEIGNILGATSGGINFTTNPSFKDFGEDIDNVPNNMLELKHIEQYEPKMSGTFLTLSPEVAKTLIGGAEIDPKNSIRVIPRADLLSTDFADIWWVGDYTNVNFGDDAGFIAIHLMNSLSTAGFQIQSEKNEKGKLSFEYQGHYSILSQDTVPFEIYVKAPESEYEAVGNPTGNPHEQGWYELVSGVYALTEDTEVVEGKTYYRKKTDTYTKVTPEGNENPHEQGWYELVDGNYVLSEDKEVNSEKTYYVKGA